MKSIAILGVGASALSLKQEPEKMTGYGVQADACFEAPIVAKAASVAASDERGLLEVYTDVFNHCSSGRDHIECVTGAFQLEGHNDGSKYLAECNTAHGGGPFPTQSGAVCRYAQTKVEKLTFYSAQWAALAAVLEQTAAGDNCEHTPFTCIMMADYCIETPSVEHCYRECLRSGNMRHVLG